MTGDRRTVTLEEPKMLPIQFGGNRDRGQLVKRYLYAVRVWNELDSRVQLRTQ